MPLWLHDVFQPLAAYGHVVAVGVYLDHLEATPVHVFVEEVVVKLQHPQFGQLIHRDPYLERAVDGDAFFPAFQLVRRFDFFEVGEVHAAQGAIDYCSSFVYATLVCRTTASIILP